MPDDEMRTPISKISMPDFYGHLKVCPECQRLVIQVMDHVEETKKEEAKKLK